MITEKEERPGQGALKKPQLRINAPDFYGAQVGWFAEADRLRAEYERTLNPRHFIALSRHLRGIRKRGVAP